MKFSALIGGFACLAIIYFAISLKGDIFLYLDPVAFLVTFGGTFAALLSTYSFHQLSKASREFISNIFEKDITHDELVEIIVGISKDSRTITFKELIDFDEVQSIPFLKNSLSLFADNIPMEQIPGLLARENASILFKNKKSAKIYSVASSISPMFGMIGTVIGLISMMSNVTDPASIPQAMSLALVTTLYGLILSVVIFKPISGKLMLSAEHDYVNRKIIIEGVNGIINKKNSELIKAGLEKIYA